MHMKKYTTHLLLLFLLLCSGYSSRAQRDTIPLNSDWQFAVDKDKTGQKEAWFRKELPLAQTIHLPHTWNVTPATENHYGWGWYQKKIQVPAHWKNKNLVLQLEAVNHTAYIYVNGKKIAENLGDGFSKFLVNLNDQVWYGKENLITIAVNNDFGKQKVPYGDSFDWPNDGGIIRPVALLLTDDRQITATYLRATPHLNTQTLQGSLQLAVGKNLPDKPIQLGITIREENQPTHQLLLDTLVTPVWKAGELIQQLSLTKVHPWHFDFPNLYRVELTLYHQGKALDRVSTTIGFRELKFENGQTFLNGERIKLMGVEWTAGSNPDFGFAEPASEILRYARLIKEVNGIFTRQHFQQSDLFYDFCDRNGILVEQEIPLWGPETPANDTIQSIAMRQLESMIRNYYNHPSIFAWGVGNELRGRSEDMRNMIGKLIDRARQCDPTRATAYISNTLTDKFYHHPRFVPDAAAKGDFIMMNEYGGSWWNIPEAKLSQYLDSVHLSYPDKPFFISEFGLCEPNFKGGDERRVKDMIYHMAVYESKPYVEGAIYFDLTDYRTHYPGTHDTGKYRRRIHGVYDMYGIPKPSMQMLRNLSTPVELVSWRKKTNHTLEIVLMGSMGLPQHTVKGYRLYYSDAADSFENGKAIQLPDITPGEQITVEVGDPYQFPGIITITRPTGYIAIQKQL